MIAAKSVCLESMSNVTKILLRKFEKKKRSPGLDLGSEI